MPNGNYQKNGYPSQHKSDYMIDVSDPWVENKKKMSDIEKSAKDKFYQPF